MLGLVGLKGLWHCLRAAHTFLIRDVLSNGMLLQIKLLRILGHLGASDKQASDNMYSVVADSMRRGNTGHTIGNAIVYEAVRTIAAIYPNPSLLQSGRAALPHVITAKYSDTALMRAMLPIESCCLPQKCLCFECLDETETIHQKRYPSFCIAWQCLPVSLFCNCSISQGKNYVKEACYSCTEYVILLCQRILLHHAEFW